jgi:hypothetical protein
LEPFLPAGAGLTAATASASAAAGVELSALCTGGHPPLVCKGFFAFAAVCQGGAGYHDFFEVPPPTEPAHEAAWRDAGLVDERGHVRLRATVRNVL